AHLPRGHRHHPPELTAAEHADRGAGQERRPRHGSLAPGRLGSGSLSSSTRRVCAARYASSRAATAGSCSATIAAASRPALTAPASPIASVPTGIPFGIWTIESSESSPFSALL